jgi:hypothetical protein
VTVHENVADPVRAGLALSVTVAVAVAEKVFRTVGVPEMRPPSLMDTPVGRPVAVQWSGAVPPDAFN